jgi:hypothetical protein
VRQTAFQKQLRALLGIQRVMLAQRTPPMKAVMKRRYRLVGRDEDRDRSCRFDGTVFLALLPNFEPLQVGSGEDEGKLLGTNVAHTSKMWPGALSATR